MKIGDSIERTWDDSWEEARQDGTMERKDWATLFMCVVWNLWKQRNEKNFKNKLKASFLLVQQIIQEVNLWKTYCRGTVTRKGIG